MARMPKEGSKREEAMDKRQAKKAGMPVAKFERSKKDRDAPAKKAAAKKPPMPMGGMPMMKGR